MHYVHYVCTKEIVYYEGVFILALKGINVTRPCCYYSGERSLRSEVDPDQLH